MGSIKSQYLKFWTVVKTGHEKEMKSSMLDMKTILRVSCVSGCLGYREAQWELYCERAASCTALRSQRGVLDCSLLT